MTKHIRTLTLNQTYIELPNQFQGTTYHYLADDPTYCTSYRGADTSLVRPGRKQATATEDFEFFISYL
jgi:hypothetical protein